MIEQALEYADRGWRVMPLHTPSASGLCSCRKQNCESNGKHPRTMNGLKDATTDPEQIRKWWSMWPDANIGIATGEESGFVVLDVDPRHHGTESITELQDSYGKFTDKVYAATGGGGWHLLFAHPGVRIGNVQGTSDRPGKLGPGVDVRGDGGYIVAPPSIHASGNSYEWKAAPGEVLPTMPEWLLAMLTEHRASVAPREVEGQEIAEGGRNNTLTSIAGTMRRRGLDETEIYVALQAINERRCRPLLAEDDVRKIANSVARYAPEDPAFIFPAKTVSDGARPDGIYFVNEFADRVRSLYRTGMRGGVSTGISALDEHYTVKLSQWTIVTGMPSHGKSAVLDAVLHNLARLHGWRIAITSIENQPLERHAAQLISLYLGLPFGEGDLPRMSEAEMEEGLQWLQKYFVFVLPEEGSCTVGGILDCVDWIDQSGFTLQGVVVDPWNELEHRRPSNMTETEYISQSLTRMRRFARMKNKHLWLVAHPTKMQKDPRTHSYPVPTLYDISGSAHFRNKADMGLSVWRDVLNEQSPTEVHVQKVRFRECGRPGKVDLYFDVTNGRFGELRPNYNQYLAREEAETW